MRARPWSKSLDHDLCDFFEYVPEGDGSGGALIVLPEGIVAEYGERPWIFRPVRQNGSRLRLRLQRGGKDAKWAGGDHVDHTAYTSDVRRGVYWRRVDG